MHRLPHAGQPICYNSPCQNLCTPPTVHTTNRLKAQEAGFCHTHASQLVWLAERLLHATACRRCSPTHTRPAVPSLREHLRTNALTSACQPPHPATLFVTNYAHHPQTHHHAAHSATDCRCGTVPASRCDHSTSAYQSSLTPATLFTSAPPPQSAHISDQVFHLATLTESTPSRHHICQLPVQYWRNSWTRQCATHKVWSAGLVHVPRCRDASGHRSISVNNTKWAAAGCQVQTPSHPSNNSSAL
jgi:hypothetical protein